MRATPATTAATAAELVARHPRRRHHRRGQQQRRRRDRHQLASKILPVRVLGRCGGYTSDIVDGDALGRWHRGARRPRQPDSGAGAQPEPRRQRQLRRDLPERHQRRHRARHGGRRRGGQRRRRRRRRIAGQLQRRHRRGATTRSGGRASYSNYGAKVALSAPGVGDPVDDEHRQHDTGGRRLRLVPGHQHGGAARRRRRLADALAEPDADAGPGAAERCSRGACVSDRHRRRLHGRRSAAPASSMPQRRWPDARRRRSSRRRRRGSTWRSGQRRGDHRVEQLRQRSSADRRQQRRPSRQRWTHGGGWTDGTPTAGPIGCRSTSAASRTLPRSTCSRSRTTTPIRRSRPRP